MKRLGLVAIIAACSHGAQQNGTQQDAGDHVFADGQIESQPDAAVDAAPTYRFECDKPVPAGSPVPTSPAIKMDCPQLVPGMNTFTSGGVSRDFILVVPQNLQPAEKLPVLFLWHWLGGSAQGFIDKGEVQDATNDERFLAIAPISVGANIFGTTWNLRWPFDISQSQQRMDQEFSFFDDMLSCAEQQFNVNTYCVSTVGVSAGALFNDQLAQARSMTLGSFMSLSGGVGATLIKPWAGAAKKLPGLVLYGGDGPPMMDGNKDILGCFGIGMDFKVASNTLEDALAADGHFMIECKHNCGHTEPPLEPPPGESKYAGIWEFAFNHPFWLPAGQSPYKNALPSTLPTWCGIGPHSAVGRSGAGCPAAENPCVN